MKTKNTKKISQPVKIYFDPIGNTMNIWWGDPADAYTAEEVDSMDRNDVIIKDKKGNPISIEMIGILPQELNISDQIAQFGEDPNTLHILQG
ncbi:MAG: hypothetical protein Q8P72_01165 [Candidatus Roizmanbacteria bacterium]|nr:hypothetical protein [Candidatus Roizmanbacteria bacterium]